MHNKVINVSIFRDFRDKIFDKLIGVKIIYPQSTLDSTGHMFDSILDFFHALVDKFGFFHETGPEGPILDSGGGTSHIEIDLVIAILHSDFGSIC